MIQPLNGNVRVNRFTDNRLILVLLLVVLLLLTVIVDDKFDRPKVVQFYDGLKTHIIKTYENDVDSFLRSQNISLAKSDILLNSLSEPLRDSMEIRLIKVSEEIVIEEEAVNCRQVMRLSETLPPPEAYELRPGKNGVKKNYYKLTYQNSVQKSRQLLGDVVSEKPVDRIILCGREAFRSSAESLDCRPMSFNVTVAADAGGRWTEELKTNGAMLGIAMVSSKFLQEGSIVELEGYGKFIVKNDEQKMSPAPENVAGSQASGGSNIRIILPREISKNFSARKRNVKLKLI
ncbi:MAG TPA: hypothetical protein DC017_05765 [Candidatus Wallbacteria bacterium]|nr:hypothetical protein [Candidatus Wallbacteria bacterium]